LANDDVIGTARQVSMDEIMYKLKITSDNAALITGDLAVVMNSVREGKGTIGMLLMDSIFAENLDAAMVNVKQGAGGFKQNMDAASHNFLLRGFLKRKERIKERERLKAIEVANDKDKKK
jgi:phospholipid/cholesterol/gamma-HCH transport system substrate-binding protein